MFHLPFVEKLKLFQEAKGKLNLQDQFIFASKFFVCILIFEFSL